MKYSDEFERDNRFWNGVGMACAVGIIICIIVIFAMLIANVKHANAGELDAWEFQFFGINYNDFENRDWEPMVMGLVVSYAAHEVGHLVSAELMGADPYFSKRVAYAGDGYNDWSDDQKALYSGAGFITQTLVGGLLTAIPATRHSDFTLGFNAFSIGTGLGYGITGGLGRSANENSDVRNLDQYGYDGTAIALTSGAINGIFTYISLDKSND